MNKASNFIILSVIIFGLLVSGCASKEIAALKTKISDLEQESATKTAQIQKLEDQLVNAGAERGALKTSLDDFTKRDQQQRKEFADLQRRFKKMTDAGTLSIRIIDGRMVVSLATDILFPSGSANLSKAGQNTLKEVAIQLSNIPDRKYQVEGHTDNVPIATDVFPSNWELASARSIRVVKTMVEAGLTPQRISAASFAETRPIQANETPEGRMANRRIAIVVIPDLSVIPGLQ